MLRDFVFGFIRIHILYHAEEKPIYGALVMKELERHGYKLTPGTLYPILHKLEHRGFIESYTKIVEGKKRKYYEITPQGSRVIEEINPKIRELVEEVLK